MNRAVRRGAAFCAALLLCLSCLSCSFGGIRIEPLEPDAPDGPCETEPPDLPETEPPETDPPETDPPEPEPPEPDPTETEPLEWVRYDEADFREKRGDGWVIKALSFQPRTICPMDGGLIFAAGMSADSSSFRCAVVDPAAMAVKEADPGVSSGAGGYGYMGAFCLNGEPYVILSEVQHVFRLDPENLTVIGSASWSDAFQSSALTLGGGRAVMRHSDHGRLVFVNPAEPGDGGVLLTETEVSLPEGFTGFWLLGAASDGMLTASFDHEDEDGWRQGYGLIDSVTGETALFDLPEGVDLQQAGDSIVMYDYETGAITLHRPGAELAEVSLTLPEDSWLLWPSWDSREEERLYLEHSEDAFIAVTAVGAGTLRTEGVLTVEKKHPWDYISEMGEAEDGLIAILYENGGSAPRLFRGEWGARADTPDSPSPADRYPTLSRSQEAEIRREIDRIYEETGVSVYVGNEAVRYLYGYAVQVVTDPAKQLEALRSLTAFFDNCPPGYIRELTEWSSTIDVCLTGKIIPEPGNRDSISDATAFVTPMDGYQIMVLDILQGGLTQTVAHEFLHIAENAMWNMHDSWWQNDGRTDADTDVFCYWIDLNPPDFEYHFVYTDESGVTLGSDDPRVWNGDDSVNIDSIYFVDGYSTTYPTEDRARIFEYLATCAPEELPESFRSDAVRKKAGYLCACLRRAFRSLADAEDVFWERSVDPSLTYEFYEENYEIIAAG